MDQGVLSMPIIVHSRYGKGGHLRSHEEENWGYMEIFKVRIEGDKRLSLDFTWAQNTPKATNLQTYHIQASAKVFLMKNSHHGFIKFCLIISDTNTCYTLWWNMGSLH